MKQIKLTQGQYALVDDEDFDELNQYKWCANYHYNSYYVVRHTPTINGERKMIYMHRLIMNALNGLQVDHINHNTLDNRKQNLRICTNSQNHMNRKPRKNTSSKYKGVSFSKRDKLWQVAIRINGKLIYLGAYKSEIQAAHAYDKQAKELFGKFALLNFKETNYDK